MIKTYPGMNIKIVELLEMTGDPISMYAAARIRELELKLKEYEIAYSPMKVP